MTAQPRSPTFKLHYLLVAATLSTFVFFMGQPAKRVYATPGEWKKKAPTKPQDAKSKVEKNLTLSASMIDSRIDKVLKAADMKAVKTSHDGEFLRRIYLDLTGRLPNRSQVLAFLADKDASKRTKLVDKLLESPEYVEHMTDFWEDVLFSTLNGERRIRHKAELRDWVNEQVEKNLRYDLFVQRLVRAQGYVSDNGAVGWVEAFNRDPMALASTTTRLFMGAQIECAQCHDHPFAEWKQEQFLEVAAFFSRIEGRSKLFSEAEIAAKLSQVKNPKRRKIIIERARRDLSSPGVFEKTRGELVVNERGEPITGKNRNVSKERNQIAPKFLFTVKTRFELPKNRREAFAMQLTSADNPYFAKMGVNRLWKMMFGRGICNPVDDLSEASDYSHPKLLNQLAEAFKTEKFNVKKLIRSIALSKAYQRASSVPVDDSTVEAAQSNDLMLLYGRMPVRPLGARPLSRAISRVMLPPNHRSLPQFERQLNRSLGEMLKKRQMDLDRFEETLQEALFMQNSPLLSARNNADRGDSYVAWLLRTQRDQRERVTRVFLDILTRPPSKTELERYLTYIEQVGKSNEKQSEAYEDVVWVLLNTSEFRYNH